MRKLAGYTLLAVVYALMILCFLGGGLAFCVGYWAMKLEHRADRLLAMPPSASSASN